MENNFGFFFFSLRTCGSFFALDLFKDIQAINRLLRTGEDPNPYQVL
jgi:hypothetical protein